MFIYYSVCAEAVQPLAATYLGSANVPYDVFAFLFDPLTASNRKPSAVLYKRIKRGWLQFLCGTVAEKMIQRFQERNRRLGKTALRASRPEIIPEQHAPRRRSASSHDAVPTSRPLWAPRVRVAAHTGLGESPPKPRGRGSARGAAGPRRRQ